MKRTQSPEEIALRKASKKANREARLVLIRQARAERKRVAPRYLVMLCAS